MENRQFHRLLLHVDIVHRLKSDKHTKNARTKDISIGGICITTYGEPLIVEEIYVLIFSLPGATKHIKAKGRVVCNREYREGDALFFDNGIQFIKLNNQYRKLIADYSIGSINL